MYYIKKIHSFVGGYQGWFHALAVVNCDAMNMRLQIPLSYSDFVLLRDSSGEGMGWLYGRQGLGDGKLSSLCWFIS